jgi:hypothetical protein
VGLLAAEGGRPGAPDVMSLARQAE